MFHGATARRRPYVGTLPLATPFALRPNAFRPLTVPTTSVAATAGTSFRRAPRLKHLNKRLSDDGRHFRDPSPEILYLLSQKQIPSIRHRQNGIQHLIRMASQYHKVPATWAVPSQHPIFDRAFVGTGHARMDGLTINWCGWQ